MLEIYYCRNEDDFKRVAIDIFQNCIDYTCVEDGLYSAKIYSCDYKPKEIECCKECELDECLLREHLQDKNVHKHIELLDIDVEYPSIICVDNTQYDNEKIIICSIREAKNNTKHGCN